MNKRVNLFRFFCHCINIKSATKLVRQSPFSLNLFNAEKGKRLATKTKHCNKNTVFFLFA